VRETGFHANFSWKPLMTSRICAHCAQSFQPRPQVPNQTYCSSTQCQRARKLRWQQDKLSTDLHYRENQQDAQRAWLDRHPGYWRAWRAANLDASKRGQKPTINRPKNEPAKMDASIPPSGLYRLRRIGTFPPEESGDWLVEITPVR
jgi:hypothetical protein